MSRRRAEKCRRRLSRLLECAHTGSVRKVGVLVASPVLVKSGGELWDAALRAAHSVLHRLRCPEEVDEEEFTDAVLLRCSLLADRLDGETGVWVDNHHWLRGYCLRVAHNLMRDCLRRFHKLRGAQCPDHDDLTQATQTSFRFLPTMCLRPPARVRLIVRAKTRWLQAKAKLRSYRFEKTGFGDWRQPIVLCTNS